MLLFILLILFDSSLTLPCRWLVTGRVIVLAPVDWYSAAAAARADVQQQQQFKGTSSSSSSVQAGTDE